jgi:3-oxoacyl-[acyl-carrier protein] reductase
MIRTLVGIRYNRGRFWHEVDSVLGQPRQAHAMRKTAIVTGGGTGVGRATVLLLAKHGFDVCIFFNSSRDAAEQTAEDARAAGANSFLYQVDVTSDAAVRGAVAATVSAFGGRLDALVNSAGATKLIPFPDLEAVTDDVWSSTMDVNVVGAFHCIRAAAPALAASGGGVIVNISSIAARLAQGSSLPYACSKAALDAMTVGLARTLAPARTRVVGVAPGFIDGDWLRKLLGPKYDATRAAWAAATPLGRVCTPDDIAAAVLSLVSGSSMVTGVTLAVDGGALVAGFALPFQAPVAAGLKEV